MPWHRSSADPCECGWLPRVAAQHRGPVEFNEALNEYHLVYDGGAGRSSMPLYFRPFCGGRAPESRRGERFRDIDYDELARLGKLTAELRTLDDVVAAFGAPDQGPHVVPELRQSSRDQPPLARYAKQVAYTSLSDTLEVHVTERQDGTVEFSFAGKPIGNPEEPDDPPSAA